MFSHLAARNVTKQTEVQYCLNTIVIFYVTYWVNIVDKGSN